MRLIIFALDVYDRIDTACRWLYVHTIFAWQTNRELKRLFDEDRRR